MRDERLGMSVWWAYRENLVHLRFFEWIIMSFSPHLELLESIGRECFYGTDINHKSFVFLPCVLAPYLLVRPSVTDRGAAYTR